jgi:hypothetical protein
LTCMISSSVNAPHFSLISLLKRFHRVNESHDNSLPVVNPHTHFCLH